MSALLLHHVLGLDSLSVLSFLTSALFATLDQIAVGLGETRVVMQPVLRQMVAQHWLQVRHYAKPGGGRYPSLYTLTKRGHRAARDAADPDEPDVTYPPHDPLLLPTGTFRSRGLPRAWSDAAHDLGATNAITHTIRQLEAELKDLRDDRPLIRWRREADVRPPAVPDGPAQLHVYRALTYGDLFRESSTSADLRDPASVSIDVRPTEFMGRDDPVAPIRADGLIEIWPSMYAKRLDVLVEYDWRTHQHANLPKLANYCHLLTLWWRRLPRYRSAAQPLVLFITPGNRMDRTIEFLARAAVPVHAWTRQVGYRDATASYHGPERIVVVDSMHFPTPDEVVSTETPTTRRRELPGTMLRWTGRWSTEPVDVIRLVAGEIAPEATR